MTQQEKENNKCIQDFMGWKLKLIDPEETDEDMKNWWFVQYNENGKRIDTWLGEEMEQINEDSVINFKEWNRLMPVVEKIHSTPAIIFEYSISLIPVCRIMYVPKRTDHKIFISEERNDITGIEAVYSCVIQFINWYNQNKDK